MPPARKAPGELCLYQGAHDECFETKEEACDSIQCPLERCGFLYSGPSFPGGPARVGC